MKYIKLYESFIDSLNEGFVDDAKHAKIEIKIPHNVKKSLKQSYANYGTWVDLCIELSKADSKVKKFFENGLANLAPTDFVINPETSIQVNSLIPTQNEIDIDKSLGWALCGKDMINVKHINVENKKEIEKALGPGIWDDYFTDKPYTVNGLPIVTLSIGKKRYIIDGHHRWSGLAMINPNAKILSYDIVLTSDDQDKVMDVLKLMQGIIAMECRERKTQFPSKGVGDGTNSDNPNNIYKMTDDQIKSYINDRSDLIKEAVTEVAEKYLKDIESYDELSDYMLDKIHDLQKNNAPAYGDKSPERKQMPQSDDTLGGSNGKDSVKHVMTRLEDFANKYDEEE